MVNAVIIKSLQRKGWREAWGDNAQYSKTVDIKILQYEDMPFPQRKKVCLMRTDINTVSITHME